MEKVLASKKQQQTTLSFSTASASPLSSASVTLREFLAKNKTTYDSKKHVFNHKWGGALKRLKRAFYPHYVAPDKQRTAGSSVSGSRIHRHVQHQVNCIPAKKCSCEKRTPKKPNTCAKAVLDLLKIEGIVPVRAEVPIATLQGCFGTSIDLVGETEERLGKQSVLISLKTGYDRHYDRHSEGFVMKEPFDQWPNTPKSHHRLQLLTEYLICRHEYQMTFDRLLIIYVNGPEDLRIDNMANVPLAQYRHKNFYSAFINKINAAQ